VEYLNILLSELYKIVFVLIPILVSVTLIVWLDRRIWGAVQKRKGPNVVGPFGLLQTVADALKYILKEIKPDFTFLMKINVNESVKRINIRSSTNRYDNFKKKFYKKVQNGFLKLSNNNKKYMIINSKEDIKYNEKIILDKFKKLTDKYK